METTMNILILHSKDGPDWTHAVMYPANWLPSQADAAAIEAFKAAQSANPDEWSWEDCEPELTKRGFVITCWHQGPTWDEEREAEILLPIPSYPICTTPFPVTED